MDLILRDQSIMVEIKAYFMVRFATIIKSFDFMVLAFTIVAPIITTWVVASIVTFTSFEDYFTVTSFFARRF